MSNRPNRAPHRGGAAQRVAAERSRRRVAAEDAAHRSRTPAIVFALVAVVLLALLIAFRATGTSSTPGQAKPSGTVVSGELNFGDVITSGEALPAYPEDPTAVDPAVGRTAPTLDGDTFAGQPLRIGFDGTPTIIMFVAHWCPHCQKEVPLIQQELDEHGKPSGVNLFAVATGTKADAANYPPTKWLAKEGWTVETMPDTPNGKAATAYGIGGFPFFVATDGAGRVVARVSGELTALQFQGLVQRARDGLPEAQVPGTTTSGSAARTAG